MKKKNTVPNSPRLLELRRHRRRAFLGKVLLYLLAFVAFFSLLTYLSRLSGLNLSSIEIKGNNIVETSTIKNIVEKATTGKYLWLFPKTNILLYPKRDIEKELLSEFKRIKDVQIYLENKKKLVVTIAEREALYTWCGTDLPLGNTNDQKCYFADKDGYMFDEAPYFSDNVYFKFFGQINKVSGNVDSPLGSYIAKDKFSKLISLRDSLEGTGIKLSSLFLKDDEQAEFYLSSNTPLPGAPKINFKLDSDFNNLALNLQAALETEPLRSDFSKKYSSLLYIDLRFGNKVYYKFK